VATVYRIGNWNVIIYTNDHRPAHVHVVEGGSGRTAVFNLNCPDGPVELREQIDVTKSELKKLRKELDRNVGYLCEEWRKIHG